MIKPFKLFAIALALCMATLQISCNNDDDANTDCQNTICTLVLIRLLVTVTDQNQDPVALDSFQVIETETGNDITISLSASEFADAQQLGQYPLIEDGILGENQERELEFKGFINNQEVVAGTYTVATDCCHVGLVSGDIELTF